MKKPLAIVLMILFILTLASFYNSKKETNHETENIYETTINYENHETEVNSETDIKYEINYENLWDFTFLNHDLVRIKAEHTYNWNKDALRIQLTITDENSNVNTVKGYEPVLHNNKEYYKRNDMLSADGIGDDGNWWHVQLYAGRSYLHFRNNLMYKLSYSIGASGSEDALDVISIKAVDELIYSPEQKHTDIEFKQEEWNLGFFKENNVLLYIIVTVPKPEEAENDEDTDYEGYKKVEQGEYRYFEKSNADKASDKPKEVKIIWHSDIGKIVLNAVPKNGNQGVQGDALDFVNFELAQQVYACIKTEVK